jgi:hypothetical protein
VTSEVNVLVVTVVSLYSPGHLCCSIITAMHGQAVSLAPTLLSHKPLPFELTPSVTILYGVPKVHIHP